MKDLIIPRELVERFYDEMENIVRKNEQFGQSVSFRACFMAAAETVLAVPEGSVVVEVAVAINEYDDGTPRVALCEIKNDDDREYAITKICQLDDSRRCIARIPVPPVPPVPVVQGVVSCPNH